MVDDPELIHSDFNENLLANASLLDSSRMNTTLGATQGQHDGDKILTTEEREYVKRGVYEHLSGEENTQNLTLHNLQKSYNNRVAVSNLSLTLFKDQIMTILGHTGSGKSTLLSLLTGVERADNGSAMTNIDGLEVDLVH